jgi:hypothetical protein
MTTWLPFFSAADGHSAYVHTCGAKKKEIKKRAECELVRTGCLRTGRAAKPGRAGTRTASLDGNAIRSSGAAGVISHNEGKKWRWERGKSAGLGGSERKRKVWTDDAAGADGAVRGWRDEPSLRNSWKAQVAARSARPATRPSPDGDKRVEKQNSSYTCTRGRLHDWPSGRYTCHPHWTRWRTNGRCCMIAHNPVNTGVVMLRSQTGTRHPSLASRLWIVPRRDSSAMDAACQFATCTRCTAPSRNDKAVGEPCREKAQDMQLPQTPLVPTCSTKKGVQGLRDRILGEC